MKTDYEKEANERFNAVEKEVNERARAVGALFLSVHPQSRAIAKKAFEQAVRLAYMKGYSHGLDKASSVVEGQQKKVKRP